MKIVNVKIAIISHEEVLNKNTPLVELTKEDFAVNIDEEFDLILLEGAYRHYPAKWKDEKDELIQSIKKLIEKDSQDKEIIYFTNLEQLKSRI